MTDLAYAERLRTEALYVSATPTGGLAWADRGVESTLISSLATSAGATAEAQRQADFVGGPLVKDTHIVPGRRHDLMLKPVQLTHASLGYAGSPTVFVIGVEEAPGGTYTTLTVLKRLT